MPPFPMSAVMDIDPSCVPIMMDMDCVRDYSGRQTRCQLPSYAILRESRRSGRCLENVVWFWRGPLAGPEACLRSPPHAARGPGGGVSTRTPLPGRGGEGVP